MSLVVNAPTGKMKEFLEKIRAVEQEIAEEKGDFLLFGLFLREDAPDVWDLLVSAPWISQKKKSDALDDIIAKLRGKLSDNEMIKLSRIVIIEKDNPELDALQPLIQTKGDITEIKDSNFFGLPIKHAYLIRGQKKNRLSGPPLDWRKNSVKARHRRNSK